MRRRDIGEEERETRWWMDHLNLPIRITDKIEDKTESDHTYNSTISKDHYQKDENLLFGTMQMYFSAKEFYGFCKGNAIKHILRSRFKGDELQDMEKAYQYLGWALKCLHEEKDKSI